MHFTARYTTNAALSAVSMSVTRQGEIKPADSSARFDEAQVVQHSLAFAGRKILIMFDPGPDLVHVGIQEAIIVGCFGLMLTGIILWSMYYFMLSSRRLASEIATNDLMKTSLELVN